MQSKTTFSTPTSGAGSGARLKISHTYFSLKGKNRGDSLLSNKGTAILDVSNISRDNSYGNKGLYRKVLEVERRIKAINPDINIIRIADANLRYYLDDKDIYSYLERCNEVLEVSKGTSADIAILKTALRISDAVIISNDRFNDFDDQFKEVKIRRVGFKFHNGEVFFYDNDGRFLF